MKENIDNHTNVVDSSADQKKQMDIALYYTHNDAEKAKNMIAGSYKDISAIKVKFSVSNTYGAFIIFFNMPYTTLMNSFAIISHSYTIDDLKTSLIWQDYEEGMMRLNNKDGHDSEMTAKMLSDLSQSFTFKVGAVQRAAELKKVLENKDGIAMNMLIQKFIPRCQLLFCELGRAGSLPLARRIYLIQQLFLCLGVRTGIAMIIR